MVALLNNQYKLSLSISQVFVNCSQVQKDALKSGISSAGIYWISDVLIKMQLLLPVLALTVKSLEVVTPAFLTRKS